MRPVPQGGMASWAIALLIMLVAALFFFEWLGSDQPQKRVVVEVQPGISTDSNGENAKN